MKLNRFQAFGTHLLGSVLVALCSAALVFVLWYPGALADATGVSGIFLMVLAVDVVVGPVITLIVFNPKKRELKRDLAVVLMLQLAALGYGLHTVFVARPIFVVFNGGRFDLVYANDMTDAKLASVTDPQFRAVPLFGPHIVAAKGPTETKARNELLFSAISGGDDLPQIPKYYVAYETQKDEVLRRLEPLQALTDYNKYNLGAVESVQKRYSGASPGAGFVPLRGRVKDLTVIVAKDSAKVLEISDVSPW